LDGGLYGWLQKRKEPLTMNQGFRLTREGVELDETLLTWKNVVQALLVTLGIYILLVLAFCL